MARPPKLRKVISRPYCCRFRPDNTDSSQEDLITLTVDEFEAIRLIDLSGMSQEECSLHMDVARTTVQSIYDSARKKLAAFIVNGSVLEISGGSYSLSENTGFGSWNNKKLDGNEESKMKIAVTYNKETGEVWQHFGGTQYFKIYEIEDNKVLNSEVYGTNGQGHGALAGVIYQLGADTVICGGIGGGAQNALTMMGIKFYGGVSGDADAAVHALLNSELVYDPAPKCNHHDHEHEHHHGDGCGCGGHHDESDNHGGCGCH